MTPDCGGVNLCGMKLGVEFAARAARINWGWVLTPTSARLSPPVLVASLQASLYIPTTQAQLIPR